MHARRYRVLDRIIEIKADDENWLGEVEKSLARFADAGSDADADVSIRAGAGSIEAFVAGGGLKMRRAFGPHDNAAWLLKTVANQSILDALAATHDILHGSAVVADDKAVLFIGGSGAGKTTLSMELNSRGYPLLCEGQIIVLRETGMIAPFPRGVESEPVGGGDSIFGRYKTSGILSGSIYENPCGVSHVFFLEDIFPGAAKQDFVIACGMSEKEVLENVLEDLPLENQAVESRGNTCWFRFSFAPTGEFGLNDLHARLKAGAARVDFIKSSKTDKPRFEKPAQLEKVSLAKAVLGLAANCIHYLGKNEPSAEINHFKAFSQLIADAEAYLLYNGSVEERAGRVMEIIEGT